MKQLLKKFGGLLAVGAILIGGITAPQVALAANDGGASTYIKTGGDAVPTNAKTSSSGFMNTVGKAIEIVFGLLGLLAVIMIIYGGFLFMTSAGNPEKVKKGKSTILYGLVGLIIALLAFVIVNFVLDSVF